MAGALGKLSHWVGCPKAENRQDVEVVYKTSSPTLNDSLPSTKFYLLKVLQLCKSMFSFEAQVLKYLSLQRTFYIQITVASF